MAQNSTAPLTDDGSFEWPWSSLFGDDHASGRVADPLHISLTSNTYPPKVDTPRADWVATGALPAFRALADQDTAVETFASIGTGAGIDALAAAEILGCRSIVVTDVHARVVQTAKANIERNLRNLDARILAGIGDLCKPLADLGLKYDVIYENLPNIPLPETAMLLDGLNSSSFGVWTASDLDTDQTYLLELHRAFLREAKSFIAPAGQALSCIGARVPLEAILRVAETEGYKPEILVYNWKLQSEASEVIRGYAEHQRKGLGPFHFYRVERVEKIFRGISQRTAAANALQLEHQLAPFAIDAETAVTYLEHGETLAHTLVVMASTPLTHLLDD